MKVHEIRELNVDELNGKGTCPSTGESAARTTRVIDRILGEYRAALP